MDRRKFLLNTAVVSAGTLLAACENNKAQVAAAEGAPSFDTWEGIRKQFRLAPGRIHMTQMLLASHPKPVRDAIERHRDALDANPVRLLGEQLRGTGQRRPAAGGRVHGRIAGRDCAHR